jgi:hypothetical protein
MLPPTSCRALLLIIIIIIIINIIMHVARTSCRALLLIIIFIIIIIINIIIINRIVIVIVLPRMSCRALLLCRSIQRSVSCAESVQQAIAAAAAHGSRSGHSAAATTPRSAKSFSSNGQQAAAAAAADSGSLSHVLGAELAVMKQAAQELGDQLQQLAQRSPTAAVSNDADCTAGVAAGGSGSRPSAVAFTAAGERLDFSFNLPGLEIPASLSADLTGFPASSARSQQQQQMPGSTAEAGQHQVPLRALDARDAFDAASAEQQDSSSVGGRSSPSLSGHVPHVDDAVAMQQQQQWLAADADAGIAGAVGGCVTMTVAALSQLQAAAQHHQRRSNKWKAKCRQLAQYLGTLNAELQQSRLLAAAGANGAAVTGAAADAAAALPEGREVAETQHHRQQADSAGAAAAAIACGQQEIQQLRQQLTAAQQVSWTCLDCRTWLVTAQLLTVHLPLSAEVSA